MSWSRLIPRTRASFGQRYGTGACRPGDDAPVIGVRESLGWIDEIVLAGFWRADSCIAVRRQRYSLVVPGEPAVTERVIGDALTVLHTVNSDWTT